MNLPSVRARLQALIDAEAEVIERFDALHKRLHAAVSANAAQSDVADALLHDLVAASGDATHAFLALAGDEQLATLPGQA